MRYFEIGKITSPHGLRGDVKIYPTTDDMSRFKRLSEVLVEGPGGLKPYEIERVWYHKQFVMLKFVGIDRVEEADKLRGLSVKIPENLALPLEEDQYFHADLYGLLAVTEDGEEIGPIIDILTTGANDVYVAEDKKAKSGRLLIPATKEFIKKVDLENQRLYIQLMTGLRDIKS